MKRLDDTLRILTALLFAFLCMISSAYASSEESESFDETPVEIVEETPIPEATECPDVTGPLVTAGIRDKVLHCEATDDLSGVYGISVDGHLYTTLCDGALDLRLEDYTDAGKTFSIYATDNAGNRSSLAIIDNPYYTAATPTPTATNPPVIIYTGTQDNGASSTQTSTGTTSSSTATPVAASAATTTGTSTTSVTSAPAPTTTPETTADEPETSEDEEITITPGTGFSQNGNAVTRDLLYDEYTNKQFITVQTRNGNTMYLVIDYDKVSDEDEEQYQTYFLNPVDEADLLALLDDDAISALTGSTEAAEEPPAVCACTDKCVVGHIDTTCPVCRTDVSKCTGVETVTLTPEPTEAPEESTEEQEKTGGSGAGSILVVFLILGLAGGGVVYFLKNKKYKPQTAGDTDFDDYPFEEDEEDDIEEISEDEEVSERDRTYRHD